MFVKLPTTSITYCINVAHEDVHHAQNNTDNRRWVPHSANGKQLEKIGKFVMSLFLGDITFIFFTNRAGLKFEESEPCAPDFFSNRLLCRFTPRNDSYRYRLQTFCSIALAISANLGNLDFIFLE